ncbi:putative Ig domain-containing protein [Eleftheria terrae]|nr:putative Ig domain-containing protein [Eleftheria terrae]
MLVLVGLSACGGGGSGADLEVDFNYESTSVEVLQSLTLSPRLHGLEGHSPRCKVVGGRLPPGMQLDRGNCRVHGTPTEAGHYTADVELTVSDYQGEVWARVNLNVDGYRLQHSVPSGFVTWGLPYESRTELAGYTAVPGDIVTYSVEGALPAGLAIHPATGVISGVPGEVGTFGPRIAVTVQRNGSTTKAATALLREITVSPPTFHYTTLDSAPNWPMTSWPVWGDFATESSFSYALAEVQGCPAALPPGLALNGQTGVISGVPTLADMSCTGIVATITRQGRTLQVRQVLTFTIL